MQPTAHPDDEPIEVGSKPGSADPPRQRDVEDRVRRVFDHLLDGFTILIPIRGDDGHIVDFEVGSADGSADMLIGGTERVDEGPLDPGEGNDPVSSVAEHHKRVLFDELCRVAETGEPMAKHSLVFEEGGHRDRRLTRAYEVRAVRVGDDLAVGWHEVTDHVVATFELERRSRELSLMGEMVDYFQSVESAGEIYDVAASFASQLFPELSGALFLENESGSLVQAMTSWGDMKWTEAVFAPERCWALRRGRRHGSLAGKAAPHCPHAAADVEAMLCIPLVVQGKATGLVVLTASRDETSIVPSSSSASEALAISVCNHLGLALTNVRLRGSLRDQSIRDPLTGLYNRRYLEETLEREIARSARSGTGIGLMMLDIDHFKDFNDTFGHSGGDALMHELGALLQRTIRLEDVACRYGGDEFVVMLPGSPPDATVLRAEEIRTEAAGFNIMHEGRVLSPASLTVGVAVHPEHGTDVATLIRAADGAMYRAKRQGGDRVLVADPPTDDAGPAPDVRTP